MTPPTTITRMTPERLAEFRQLIGEYDPKDLGYPPGYGVVRIALLRELLAEIDALRQAPSERVEEYLGTLAWGDDEVGRGVGRAVQTHLRYFARWLCFPVGEQP